MPANLGPTEIIIIAAVIFVLFGAKKMPDAARSFGRSLRIFKSETKGLRDEDDKEHGEHKEHKDRDESSGGHTRTETQELAAGDNESVLDGRVLDRDRAHQHR